MRCCRGWMVPFAFLSAGFAPAPGGAIEVGKTLDDVRLPSLEGKPTPLVDRGSAATVALFFRPGQERSVEVLGILRDCQAALAGKPARFVGVVSDGEAPEAVRTALAQARSTIPTLRDPGDALYAALAVRTHPAAVFLDASRKVVAFEPYRPVRFGEIVIARVRRILGEISDAELARELAPPESRLPGEDPRAVAGRHVKFGRKLLAAGAIAQAHESARRSLEIAPSAAAFTLQGEIFAAEGDCRRALAAFESALKLDPGDTAAMAGRKRCTP